MSDKRYVKNYNTGKPTIFDIELKLNLSAEDNADLLNTQAAEIERLTKELAYCYNAVRIVYKQCYLDGGEGYTAFKYVTAAVEALKETKAINPTIGE